MDFNAFAREMEHIGEELPNDIEQSILQAAYIVVEEIRAQAPKGDTNQLRDSIRARVINGEFLGISMKDYGWYQNYGVRGLNNKTQQFGVPTTVAQFLGVPPGYEFHFGTPSGDKKPGKHYWGIHYPGIKGKMFFQIDRAVDRVIEIVNQNLEL